MLGLRLVPAEARGQGSLEQAFTKMVSERAHAVLVLGEPVLFNYRSQIGALALRNRLVAISTGREYAEAGLLLTYGVECVDKIFKGAKPADLPVEQPVRFELIINLNTTRALDLFLPPTLLARADEVIE